MQRLSRLYVSHFGSPTAWYDHLLFDLSDPETKLPTDVVFNLENAGGKTSLLSFIFSCFDPKQERWLQHLQQKNHRFSEYFVRDGRPSFILMEWAMPPRTSSGQDYKLVIGQAVSLKENVERGAEIERWFFSYESTHGLVLEDVPAHAISPAPVRTMQEFVQWMHQASKRSAGDFFHTKIQDDWIKHLGGPRLLDIDMLRMQVDFNSNEGGMEEGFLTFNNEADLLRRFLLLTLDGERSATVREAVAQTVDKLKSKPRYERRLEQLKRLQLAVVPFGTSATSFEQAEARQQQAQFEVGGALAALALEKARLSAKVADRVEYQQMQTRIAEDARKTVQLMASDNVAIKGLQFERRIESLRQANQDAQAELSQQRAYLWNIEATKALVAVETAKSEVEHLDTMHQLRLEGLRPMRQEAEIQGALLWSALREAEKIELGRKKAVEQQEAKQTALINAVDASKSAFEVEIRGLAAERGSLQQFEQTYATQKNRLVSEGLLKDAEKSADAVYRFGAQQSGMEEELVALREESDRLEDEERESIQQANAYAIESNQAISAQAPHRKLVHEGEALRLELQESQVLATSAEAEQADPDSPALLEALDRLLADAERQIAQRNVRIAQLDLDRSSIVETGLAGRSADIDAVVRQLQSVGIRSARAANTYIAELMPDAQESRALVKSDPARFLGVNVAQGEWVRTQDAVNKLALKLSTPVTIAVAALSPSEGAAERMVVPSQDDAAYNKEAAKVVQVVLDERIRDSNTEKSAFKERQDQGLVAKAKLTRYQNEFGVTRIRLSLSEIERLEMEGKVAQAKQQQCAELAAQARDCKKLVDQKAAALPQQIAHCKACVRRLQEFQQDLEFPLAAKQVSLREIEAKIAALEKRTEQLAVERANAEKARLNAVEDRLRYENSAKSLAEEQAQIVHRDQAWPATEQLQKKPIGIETLRRVYAEAVDLLETSEKDQLGVLAVELKRAREDFQKAETQFKVDFSTAKLAELTPLRALDFEPAIRDQKALVHRCEETSRGTERELATAEGQAKEFWSGSKHRPVASIETRSLSDSGLVERLSKNTEEIEILEASATSADHASEQARTEATQAENDAKQVANFETTLRAAIPTQVSGVDPSTLPVNIGTYVSSLISKCRALKEESEEQRRKAEEAFRELVRVSSSKELDAVEPELARDISASKFELACTDRERIASLIVDRIQAVEDTLDGMKPDFENCVGEVYNLSYDGISLLTQACAKTMPLAAPYVGGKPILKMAPHFTGIAVERRKESIRQYLNVLIDTGLLPAKGADLVAQCLVAISGRKDLGIQVLKMEQNEAYQYQPASELKGSKGQGTVIAMFLYLVISQLRADTQARARRGGGGPLILDNPFAKVQTRALVDAQRLLAKEIGVQLIFFTANADPNIIAGFRRVIRLRKSGVNTKTNRSQIEMVSAAFEDLSTQDIELV